MDTDEHLFERTRSGDIAAFDVLYERYEVRLFAYLRAISGNRQDAEELLHDAFLAALKAGENGRGEAGAFCGFLYRVARNLAFNRRRAALRHDRMLSSVPDFEAEAEQARPSVGVRADTAIERRELEAALADAVGRLPLALGELYHLRSSGLSYEQIAAVIEAPLGTVKSRMHQMVNVLREELKPWIAPQ
ncbi:MAG TPA: sigma-70 family RNA polymerase sigma factor [Labilithrix sp.]|nr:sigma-70 family RNA polymerase sigma factor [Labilithrix sp.]